MYKESTNEQIKVIATVITATLPIYVDGNT